MSPLAIQQPHLQNEVADEVRLALTEVLGTVAHELRQPLSNIEAIAYYLRMILPQGDTKIQSQLTRIRELVEQSNWILSSALSLAGSSPPAPQPIALEELITEAVSSSGAAHADVRLALSGDLPLVRLDPREGRDLVDSLLMLFRIMADGAGPVTVTTSARPEGGVLLEIHAPVCPKGIAGAGSELALESARRIAASHGGTFVLETGVVDAGGREGGIRGRLMLP
jgi:signal transduction histidine kinase